MSELVELQDDSTSVEQVKQLLLAFSESIKKTPTRYDLTQLLKYRVFPVQGREGQKILKMSTDARWFIPDRPSYKKTFDIVVHLFDFSLRELEVLEPLLQRLVLMSKKISRNIMETSLVKGGESAVLNVQYT